MGEGRRLVGWEEWGGEGEGETNILMAVTPFFRSDGIEGWKRQRDF